MRIHPHLELNPDLAKNFLEHLSHLDRLAGAEVDDLRFLGRTGYCPESRSHGVDIEKISNRVQIAGGEECSPGVCCGHRLATKAMRVCANFATPYSFTGRSRAVSRMGSGPKSPYSAADPKIITRGE